MTSTFREMFDDSRLRISLYTEKLTYTEDMFMRLFVDGLKKFQREVMLEESRVTLTRVLPQQFVVPADYFWVKGLTDAAGVDLTMNSPEQFFRNRQKAYEKEIPHLDLDRYRQFKNKAYVQRRIYTVIDREILLFPDNSDTSLSLWYVPSVQSFSRGAAPWAAWFVDDAAFQTRFNADALPPEYTAYENALIEYVVAELLKIDGNEKYRLIEASFWAEVERAKVNKQQLFRRGYADTVQSPWR